MFKDWIVGWLSALDSEIPRLMLVATLFIVFGVMELLVPAERGQSLRGKVRNITYLLLYLVLGYAVCALILLNLPLQPRQYQSSGVAQSLICIIAQLLLMDFFFYWYHRAQHSFAWFWPVHELHHADNELNVTSSMRSYWLELPLQAIFIMYPSALIVGVDKNASLLLPFVITLWLYFTHANIRLPLGRLTPVFCGPQLHRIHHSVERQHLNRNFAQFFPIYDVIFGTYYAPSPDEFPATGTKHLVSDAAIADVMSRPFSIWRRILLKYVIA